MTSRMISSWDSWVCNNNWVRDCSTSAAERPQMLFLFDDKEELLFDDNLDNVPLESISLERQGIFSLGAAGS